MRAHGPITVTGGVNMALTIRKQRRLTAAEVRQSLLRDAKDPSYMATVRGGIKQANAYVQTLRTASKQK